MGRTERSDFMKNEDKGKKNNKIKSFLSGLVNKIDKKMLEKAKSKQCCCSKDSSKDK